MLLTGTRNGPLRLRIGAGTQLLIVLTRLPMDRIYPLRLGVLLRRVLQVEARTIG